MLHTDSDSTAQAANASTAVNRLETEKALLVALLRSSREFSSVAEQVGVDHFSTPTNRQLFSAIGKAVESGELFTLTLLYSRLPIETDDGLPWRAIVPVLLMKYEDDVRSPITIASDLAAMGVIIPMPPMPDGIKARDLTIESGNLPATAKAVRDLLASAGCFFERDVPCQVVTPAAADSLVPSAVTLSKHNVAMAVHRLCKPINDKGTPVTLPERVANMYLDMRGEWNLPPLSGITTAPLLSDDGSIRTVSGYDLQTGLWCTGGTVLSVPKSPSIEDARGALSRLRQAFRTFPFADAQRGYDDGVEVVDPVSVAGQDESTMLATLMTAVCRASLHLAPGALFTAPSISGAGSGKGLLVRAICAIAFGTAPKAFTMGADRVELDKRISAELIEAAPVLFLDNVNGVALRSDALASVLTERPARVRILGQTRMATLNSAAWIAVTGNGLTVTEDLARRFIFCELDARCEDPESRYFTPGFLASIISRRADLLTDVLTIWRWGRQNDLARGAPLGSYETWAEWCRDPLLALGCRDPVERIAIVKANDPKRLAVAEIFCAWWAAHGETPLKASALADSVTVLIDPQSRGRQYISTKLSAMAETRAAGFVLTKQKSVGTWSAATYAMRRDA